MNGQPTEMVEIVVPPEESGCIDTVPPKFRQANPKAYTPHVVSIGPFHKPRGGDNILKQMEERKPKYLQAFINRTKLDVEDFVPKHPDWENRIRSCYAGPVNFDRKDFLEMIIIDACFIIEYFLRCYKYKVRKENDPLLFKPWKAREIQQDLILLENQLPFFVLEGIYNLANRSIGGPSFLKITFRYFKDYNTQNINPEGVRPKHFTDLLRTFMLPPFDLGTTEVKKEIRHLYTATRLWEAGLVFQVIPEGKSLLDLEFHKGELTMPSFQVHDSTEIYIRNLLAFEECQCHEKQYIAQYFKILDFLINTEKDVNLLVENKIIVNGMGDDNAVATMVNNLGKSISMPYFSSKYFTLCNRLNRFYENPRNKYKASFMQEYFNTPWKIASTFAAVLLLLLTLIQTICSVLSLA